ncbi:MAG: hypothetical protein AMJ79_09730 [Phycisphaerae bacterium SM23_30]|nr:MAG: hypothetical protein AMJ79_09730 [Phycisphaerae bacterium SM23_30]
MPHEEILSKIVEIHQRTKALMILAEEIDVRFNTFLQPGNEQRHVLEHIMRAQAAELGILSGKDEAYIEKNYDKALGHAYRAFFDTADWLGWALRKKISDILKPSSRKIISDLIKPYSNECIMACLPNYYSEIRPKLEHLNRDIAAIRARKDIGDSDNLLTEVTAYSDTIQELLDFIEHITKSIPAMEEWNKRNKRTTRRKRLWDIILVLIGVGFGALLAWLKLSGPSD